jgi:hypothetical protein
MAHIQKPNDFCGQAENVSQLLDCLAKWQTQHGVSERGFQSRVWFRGHADEKYQLKPGVYRNAFTARTEKHYGADKEEKRLNLEREMLSNFRTAGAYFVEANSIVEVYFMAQHYGMPTRLLDWTTNPLAGDEKEMTLDGEVIIMDAVRNLPKNPPSPQPRRYPSDVSTMRYPYVTDALGDSFWHEPKEKNRDPLILPVRPDNLPGRIGQQSSCFTLHMHGSKPVTNSTLERIKVPAKAKRTILEELHRLNINQFTIFNDLDNLSREIRRTWGV